MSDRWVAKSGNGRPATALGNMIENPVQRRTNMAKCRTAVAVALAATVGGIAFVAQVQAGADKVAFPANYQNGVKWLVVDRADNKQVHDQFVTPAALEAARKDQPMPDGTVFTVVRYAAQLDAQGNPVKGADGRFIKGELLGFNVMEKHTGWGSEYPETLRNGEWEYRAFTPDKKPNETVKLTVCFECHKPQASRDFVQAYDKLKAAAR
jgi:hypothetical protein